MGTGDFAFFAITHGKCTVCGKEITGNHLFLCKSCIERQKTLGGENNANR